MRDFDTLDTHAFKAFYYAAETQNFTLAARRAALTQSGVSQHIARLEDQLGVPLFLRVNKRVLLTDAGRRLRTHVERYLDEVQALREEVGRQSLALRGLVSYAMPASCLMSPHFPLLLQARREQFPQVDLRVTLCPSEQVIALLLEGAIDFGFVTRAVGNPAIAKTEFCEEEYILVGSHAPSVPLTPETLVATRFLAHPGVEVLFDCWRVHHFPRAPRLGWDSLPVVGGMNSIEGVLEMAAAGMGLTIVPRHCVDARLQSGALVEIPGPCATAPRNRIHIVSLAGARLTRRCQAVIEAFLAMKA